MRVLAVLADLPRAFVISSLLLGLRLWDLGLCWIFENLALHPHVVQCRLKLALCMCNAYSGSVIDQGLITRCRLLFPGNVGPPGNFSDGLRLHRSQLLISQKGQAEAILEQEFSDTLLRISVQDLGVSLSF